MTDETRPSLPLPGLVFVAAMLVAGLALAFLLKAYPGLGQAIPGLMWLLGVALVVDIVINTLAMQGRIDAPLAMPWRFGGYFAGAILHTLAAAQLG
ncbi:hypothetical protein [Phreatobacter oligotrophus]|uniref:Uncharacterized protein n=1 Tax=Phreatobacter oligotrophus TaxID=1122261 RepID=A0A2T4YXJ3_9HYPH|nr:hypothetical protein [Phreatobacter oligotrophus]PTM51080.1 hypothetical protein C8P69_1118 [Phreatobacter oligotrophus]